MTARWVRAGLIGVAALVVACSSTTSTSKGGGVRAGAGAVATTTAGTSPADDASTSTVTGAAAPSTSRAGGASTTAAPGGRPPPSSGSSSTPTSAATAGTGSTSPRPTAAATDPVVAAASGPPGAAAGVILAPRPAASIVVEVLQEPGATVDRQAFDLAVRNLRDRSAKAVTVAATVALPAGSTDRRWTPDDLRTLVDRSTAQRQGGNRIVLHYVYVRGQLDTKGVLGVAIRGDVLAVFPDQTSRLGTTATAVQAIVVHETGHLLGLVDLWLARGRADTKDDPAKAGHSTNQGSVMYWQVNTDVSGLLLATPSTTFDSLDLADLDAIRAGAPRGSNP